MSTPTQRFGLYFAYGSNMNSAQMRRRVPRAEALGGAVLAGWRVVERQTADIEPCDGAQTHGVLYLMPLADIARLDAFEGAPRVYARRLVRVAYGGRVFPALTYVMTPATVARRTGVPYAEEYRQRCWQGAHEHALPNAYTKKGTQP